MTYRINLWDRYRKKRHRAAEAFTKRTRTQPSKRMKIEAAGGKAALGIVTPICANRLWSFSMLRGWYRIKNRK